MKKDKKLKRISNTLCKQADQKNLIDCQHILDELNLASLSGEYSRSIKLKENQAQYLKKLKLSVSTDPQDKRFGQYKISWNKNQVK